MGRRRRWVPRDWGDCEDCGYDLHLHTPPDHIERMSRRLASRTRNRSQREKRQRPRLHPS